MTFSGDGIDDIESQVAVTWMRPVVVGEQNRILEMVEVTFLTVDDNAF